MPLTRRADPAPVPDRASSFREGETVFLRIPLKVRGIGLDHNGRETVGISVPTTWGGATYFGVHPEDLARERPPPSRETPG